MGGVSITPVDKTSTTTAGHSSSSTSSQSNVDPNLTDDTFVVEAPSFIVPYVYEKPPKGIKDFKESIDKIVEDKKKEKERKKAAGEEVSDDEDSKKKKGDDSDDDSEAEEEKKLAK